MTSCHSSLLWSTPPSLQVSSSFQDSHSKATPKETHPGLSWHPKPQICISSFIPLWNCAVYNQLSSYLSENDLIEPNHSGFRTAHSSETASSQWLRHSVPPESRSVHQSSFLYSAFDTVNHQILLSTLAEHRWLCSNMVLIVPDKSHLSGHLEGLLVKTPTPTK